MAEAWSVRVRQSGSPVREPRLDLSEERRAPLGRRMIHVVLGEIIATRAGRADPTHGPRQEAAWRIAHHERQPSRPAIGANDAETLDVVKTGIVGAVLAQSEADAGQKNLVDESL